MMTSSNHNNTSLSLKASTTSTSTTTKTESQQSIEALSSALAKMQSTTTESTRCSHQLTKRARHLNSLTSPASDASAQLTQASANLSATLALMKEARDQFDIVQECISILVEKFGTEARIMHVVRGQQDPKTVELSSEQLIYDASSAMDTLRECYFYFLDKPKWKSVPVALADCERILESGSDAMCMVVSSHLTTAGQAARLKRTIKGGGGDRNKKVIVPKPTETANETRERLSAALQNRDLMKSIGEYQEYVPLKPRHVRELRAIFLCLGGEGAHNKKLPKKKIRVNAFDSISMAKVVRTEKVGSGGFTNLAKKPLSTGFPHLDAYAQTRKSVAYSAIDGYYRQLKSERRRRFGGSTGVGGSSSPTSSGSGRRNSDKESTNEADWAARDAVRTLEHAMVLVAGEKAVYRCVVSPHKETDESLASFEPPDSYKKLMVSAYSYVVAAVVDRIMDVVESIFLREGGLGQPKEEKVAAEAAAAASAAGGAASPTPAAPTMDVQTAAAAAAGGLRMLDGIRMLGPSLAKLCDMSAELKNLASSSGKESHVTVASSLCITIHRITVKNASKTLENLAVAIQDDPLDGEKYRPADARVAPVTTAVARAVQTLSPYESAYKSVTKRRALVWDPNIGEEAGDLDYFIQYLIIRLVTNLQGKALNYTRDPVPRAQAMSNLFMINNMYYLKEQLGTGVSSSNGNNNNNDGGAVDFKIDIEWFEDKVGSIYEGEKNKYLGHWEVLNKHLTSVDSNDLNYQKDHKLLSLESGRLIKGRFHGFNEDWERIYEIHAPLKVASPALRDMLQKDVKGVFLSRYRRFFEKYSKIQFSKKNMDQYLKYPPKKVESMLSELFVVS